MKINNLFFTFLSLIAFLIIQSLLFLILLLILDKKPETNDFGILIINFSFIIIIWFCVKYLKIKNIKRFVIPNYKTVFYIILLAILFVIVYPFITIFNFANNLSENFILYKQIITDFDKLNSVFYFIGTVITTPILEEIYYRKIIYSEIKKKYSAFWAILISSFFFALLHMDYVQFQSAFVFGILSGYLYYKTDNISISIILHSLINLLIFFTNDIVGPLDKGVYYLLIPFYIFLIVLGLLVMSKTIKSFSEKKTLKL